MRIIWIVGNIEEEYTNFVNLIKRNKIKNYFNIFNKKKVFTSIFAICKLVTIKNFILISKFKTVHILC